jgi:hypothetical protein
MSKHLLNINEITNEALRALEDQLKFGDSLFGPAPMAREGSEVDYGINREQDEMCVEYEDPDAQEVVGDESDGQEGVLKWWP